MPQTMADPFKSIPMSPNLGRTLGRAQEFAREQSHRALLLEHVLLALTEDPEASAVLRACSVDLVRLSTDVSGYLGRLPEDMRGDPGIEAPADHELLRVLEAARQAAHQSRRRQIDGSIVLAAIVGDGKSPAAGLLKAHGMTFDEAIRALQKASAQARSKQYASPPGGAEPPAKADKPAPAPAPAAPPAPPVEPPSPAPAPAAGQSVDEILAAARARIQQRAPPKPEPKPAAKPPAEEPENLPLMSLSAFKAAPAPPAPDMPPRPDGQDEGPPAASPGPAGGAAPPLPPALPSRLPLPPPSQAAPPPPRSLQQAIEGAQPPAPPPPRAGPDGPAPPPLPGLAPRAPWPDPAEPAPPRRPPAANGKLPPPRRGAPEIPARPPARSAPAPRSGQRAAAGPLVETIPRRMRLGAPSPAQVRIGRDKIDGLMQLLMAGRPPQRPEVVIAHSLTVRLRAPDGGFWIEAGSPETQWVDATARPQPEEPVSWRWTVTPQRGGRRRLQLLVAARMIGQEGIVAEAAPPDRVIEVAVAGNPGRRVLRWIFRLALLGIAAVVGRYGLELWENGPSLINRLLNNILGLLVSSGFLGG